MTLGFRGIVVRFVLCLGASSLTDVRGDALPLKWEKTDTTLSLHHEEKTLWCLVFDPSKPKSYFHPLAAINGRVMTAFEPQDHPWHRGLWWSWKYINGVNYWEEDRKTGKSAGTTTLTRAAAVPADDFSARVELDFHYHLPEQPPVLTEQRLLTISSPDESGTYLIDWDGKFTAGAEIVKLDRTLPAHLGGVAYGGYAGLSLRMAKGLDGFSFRTDRGQTTPQDSHGKPALWMDSSDSATGIAILDHPDNPRHVSPWYLHAGREMRFFSPAPLFDQAMEILPNQSVSFRYRIIVHSSPLTTDQIEEHRKAFTTTKPAKP